MFNPASIPFNHFVDLIDIDLRKHRKGKFEHDSQLTMFIRVIFCLYKAEHRIGTLLVSNN